MTEPTPTTASADVERQPRQVTVAVTCTHLIRDIEGYRSAFADAGLTLHLPDVPGQELAGAALVAAMEGVAGVVAGDDQFTDEVMAQLPDLEVISKWGIGLDGIDLASAANRGIAVTNTPGMFGNEVAEQGLAYLFALVRGIVDVDREVRSGGWPKPVGRSIGSLSATVLGLGDIGRTLVTKLVALGVTVTGSDPSPSAAEWAAEAGITIGDAASLARDVDVVMITAPLNNATRGMVDESFIGGMRKGSWLINVGRGPIVVGDAVADAIDAGHLAGAALDVFEVEPLADERMRNLANVILGSHNASNTYEACHRTHEQAIKNLVTNLSM
ncbi:MAG: D-3-phosphoglycerate dehydrogenase [Verrucomicrobiales bacterium]|jgi:D-3-phosphoglycerate dehydrogenase